MLARKVDRTRTERDGILNHDGYIHCKACGFNAKRAGLAECHEINDVLF